MSASGVGIMWKDLMSLGMMMLVGIIVWSVAWLLSFSFSVAQIVIRYRFQQWV